MDWTNYTVKGEDEEVEDFLWNADIGSVIFTMDPAFLKNSLFTCMTRFPNNAAIQNRCLQLLQDCHILTAKGITNEELSTQFDILVATLSRWLPNIDVVLNLMQLLAMIADREVVRKRCCQVEDTEILQYLEKAMRMHLHARPVQHSGLQLFEEIIKNSQNEHTTSLILRKVFQIVLDNLLINIMDPAICHSSFAILSALAEKKLELLLPWLDHIINLTMNTIANLYSAEVVFKCLVLLEKLAASDENLVKIAAHERGLMALCDGLGLLTPKQLTAALIALRIMQRALEDTQVTYILNEHPEVKDQFLDLLQSELTVKFDKYLAHCQEHMSSSAPSPAEDDMLQEYFLLYNCILEIIHVLKHGEDPPEPEPEPEPVPPTAAAAAAAPVVVSATRFYARGIKKSDQSAGTTAAPPPPPPPGSMSFSSSSDSEDNRKAPVAIPEAIREEAEELESEQQPEEQEEVVLEEESEDEEDRQRRLAREKKAAAAAAEKSRLAALAAAEEEAAAAAVAVAEEEEEPVEEEEEVAQNEEISRESEHDHQEEEEYEEEQRGYENKEQEGQVEEGEEEEQYQEVEYPQNDAEEVEDEQKDFEEFRQEEEEEDHYQEQEEAEVVVEEDKPAESELDDDDAAGVDAATLPDHDISALEDESRMDMIQIVIVNPSSNDVTVIEEEDAVEEPPVVELQKQTSDVAVVAAGNNKDSSPSRPSKEVEEYFNYLRDLQGGMGVADSDDDSEEEPVKAIPPPAAAPAAVSIPATVVASPPVKVVEPSALTNKSQAGDAVKSVSSQKSSEKMAAPNPAAAAAPVKAATASAPVVKKSTEKAVTAASSVPGKKESVKAEQVKATTPVEAATQSKSVAKNVSKNSSSNTSGSKTSPPHAAAAVSQASANEAIERQVTANRSPPQQPTPAVAVAKSSATKPTPSSSKAVPTSQPSSASRTSPDHHLKQFDVNGTHLNFGDESFVNQDSAIDELIRHNESSQQQADAALRKANEMHRLYVNATKQLEEMVSENDQLWQRLRVEEEFKYRMSLESASPVGSAKGQNQGSKREEEEYSSPHQHYYYETVDPNQRVDEVYASITPKSGGKGQEVSFAESAASTAHYSQQLQHRHNLTTISPLQRAKHKYRRLRLNRNNNNESQAQEGDEEDSEELSTVDKCKQSLAFAGTIEALDQLDLTSRFHVSEKASTTPEDLFEGKNRVVLDLFVDYINEVFTHAKQYSHEIKPALSESLELQQQNIISLRSLRSLLKHIGLVDGVELKTHEMEIILSSLQVRTISPFGVAFAVILCGHKRYSSTLTGLQLVATLNDLLSRHLQQLDAEEAALSQQQQQLASPGKVPLMAVQDLAEVLKLLEKEKKALITIYEAYASRIPPPSYSDAEPQQRSGSNSGNNTPQGRVHNRATIKLSDNSFTLGLSLENVMSFSKDFQVTPELVSRMQLVKVFNSIVTDSGKTASSSSATATITFVQVSNFLMLLNQSGGKEKIAGKSRSSSLVVFRVNPVDAFAPPRRSGGAGTNAAQSSPMGNTSVFSTSSGSGKSSRGGSQKINMDLLSPTKVIMPVSKPYYDSASQSIVQTKRKKHVSELHSLLSQGK